MIMCKYCQKSSSSSGKQFTQKTLKQHIRNAHPIMDSIDSDISVPDGPSLEMAHLLADDESDGVFWAMAAEFDEHTY